MTCNEVLGGVPKSAMDLLTVQGLDKSLISSPHGLPNLADLLIVEGDRRRTL